MSHKKAKAVRKALKLSGIDYRQHDYKMTNLKSHPYIDEAEMKLAKSESANAENPSITQESLIKKVVKFYNTCTLVLQEGCGKQIYRQTKQQMSI